MTKSNGGHAGGHPGEGGLFEMIETKDEQPGHDQRCGHSHPFHIVGIQTQTATEGRRHRQGRHPVAHPIQWQRKLAPKLIEQDAQRDVAQGGQQGIGQRERVGQNV